MTGAPLSPELLWYSQLRREKGEGGDGREERSRNRSSVRIRKHSKNPQAELQEATCTSSVQFVAATSTQKAASKDDSWQLRDLW